jgi:hypothetical protein
LSPQRLEPTLFGMRGVFVHAMLRRASTSAVAIAIVCASIAPAAAVVPTAGVTRHGVCVGGPSSWRLRATAEGAGTLVVRFRLTGGSPGETWNLFLDDNGSGFFAGSRVSDATGLVRVRRSTDDLAGEDIIRAAGHDVATGEVCRGRVRI